MKKWYLSKTIWVNLITVAAAVFAVFEGNEWIMANPQAAATVGAVIGGLNVALRAITSQGVTK